MDIKALKKITELDIFSLLVFKIIYETGFANLAAKELSVSAPKISRCLTSLRLTFDDELFYRRQQGLKPTALAEHLYQPICDFCESAAHIERIACAGNSTNSSDILNIAVTPIIMTSLSMELGREEIMTTLGKIRVHLWNEHSEDKIHQGDIDLGINFSCACSTDLESEVIGESLSTSVIARQNHPIWDNSQICLDEMANYPFVILEGKGFNDKLDPFQIYCRQTGIEPPSINRMGTISEWFCHLLTMRSVSFMSTAESEMIAKIPDIRVERLPTYERNKLIGNGLELQYNIIERTEPYRRYCNNSRTIIIDSLKRVISK